MNISIYEPNIAQYTKSAIEAINSGWISNHGIYVKLATEKLKEITKAKHVILMSNGTTATHCLLLSLKFKFPNIKNIYTSNNCFVAAWNCILNEYDKNCMKIMKMDENTWNIDTSEEYIKTLETNSAVLIVHNLGNIVNVPRLKKIRPDLIFLEDNCEGIFGKYENSFANVEQNSQNCVYTYSGVGDSTLCSSVSFYGNKTITTGEGGAFFTNDDDIYNYISKVYSHGMSNIRYIHDMHAYNYRMTNIEAAFLYDQLNDIDNILSKKKIIFDNYNKIMKKHFDSKKICTYKIEENTQSSNWMYAIRIIGNKLSVKETYDYFIERGIDVRPFFYPINSHEYLKDMVNNDDVSYILNREIIMIPSSPLLTYEKQLYVSLVIENFLYANGMI
jgi:perosamine synthetase